MFQLLMPTGVDYNCRSDSASDINNSNLSTEVNAYLNELIFDYLSPQGTHRLVQRRAESILRIRTLVQHLRAAACSKPWEAKLWEPPTRQQRLMLDYMWGQNQVSADRFIEHVFDTHDAAGFRKNTISAALTRLNTYLAGYGHPRTLKWDRAGRVVCWE